MFRIGKGKKRQNKRSRNPGRGRGPGRPDEKLAKRILGKDSGRRVFGFACAPDIHAQMKVLAGELNVPIYALAEHLLQLSVWLVTRAKENPAEMEQLQRHLVQVHVEARTVEKLSFYDEQLAKDLNEQRIWRFGIESAVREIVMDYVRKGMKPNDVPRYVDYGHRCAVAVLDGQPLPRDFAARARFRKSANQGGKRDQWILG
jgi:hypothetical protein